MTSTEKCPHCPASVGIAATRCEACQRAIDFPNVRYARRTIERENFQERLHRAEEAAEAAGTLDKFNEFRVDAANSVAVMNRYLAPLHGWMHSDNQLFQNFHRQVENGRVPVDDQWNRQRTAAENAVSPGFFSALSVAALTLDDFGMSYYGPYAVVLRNDMIEHRATVFEENPFLFNERMGVLAGKDAPVGYRELWAGRGDLAATKLQPKLRADTDPTQFSNIIINGDRNGDRCDFIEVHIYGSIHTSVIQTITGPAPTDEIDAILWKHVKQMAAVLGAKVVEI